MTTIKEHNVATGEEIEREMNAEELAQWEKDQAAEATRQAVEAQKAADKAALLEKLGISEDEARLLLG
jgi:predicted metal-dependent HD superfamily phosphohydrolase